MTHHAKRRDTLTELVFDMEAGVSSLVGLATVVRDLGTCGVDVTPLGLFALGEAMIVQAKAVEEEWERLFDLTRRQREAPPCA